MAKYFFLFCMVVMATAASSRSVVEAAISCSEVVSSLAPCFPYVTTGGTVSPSCCIGIRHISDSAPTTPDRRGVCTCLKTAASSISFTSYNLALAAALPARCGVNVPYQISPLIDCNRIK